MAQRPSPGAEGHLPAKLLSWAPPEAWVPSGAIAWHTGLSH